MFIDPLFHFYINHSEFEALCFTEGHLYCVLGIVFYYPEYTEMISYVHYLSQFAPRCVWRLLFRMGRRTAGGDLVTVETQKRICSAVLDVTTGPAASVWIRADAHFTAAEHLGCTAASSAAAWFVHTHTHTFTQKLLSILNKSRQELCWKTQITSWTQHEAQSRALIHTTPWSAG